MEGWSSKVKEWNHNKYYNLYGNKDSGRNWISSKNEHKKNKMLNRWPNGTQTDWDCVKHIH